MKRIILCAVLLLISTTATAQQEEQLSLYNYNTLFYNPAYAGSRDAVSMVGIGRFQWVNMSGAPMTQWFSVHSPVVGKSFGIGAHMVNDKIGSRNRTAAFLDLSTSVQVAKNGTRLAFGLSAGADFISRDFSNLNVDHQADEYNTNYSFTKFNVGAGLYLYSDKAYFGLSVPRMMKVEGRDPNNVLNSLINRHYYLSAGYVFSLNSILKLKPSTLVKFIPYAPLKIDVNATFILYDFLHLSAMYRITEAAGLNTVVRIKDSFFIGYSYEFPINGLATYQSGSHEVLLQLDLKGKNRVKTSPRHF